jgi:hypothetical protein
MSSKQPLLSESLECTSCKVVVVDMVVFIIVILVVVFVGLLIDMTNLFPRSCVEEVVKKKEKRVQLCMKCSKITKISG